MLESNGAHMKPSTRDIKEKITSHIVGVHFMKLKRRNESDHVFTTTVRDAAMEDAMAKTTESDIRQLFESALYSELPLLPRTSTHGNSKEN